MSEEKTEQTAIVSVEKGEKSAIAPQKMSVRLVNCNDIGQDPITKGYVPSQAEKIELDGANEWLSHPYDMRGLKKIVNESTIIPQCTRAYKNNIAGFGIGVRYIDDEPENADRIAEYNKMQQILDLLSMDMNTKEVFEDLIEAREIYGIAYLEVVRNYGGEVAQIDFIKNTPSIKKTIPLEPWQEVNYWYKGTPHSRYKKFCKYRQDIGGRTVYFKEFGDPRIMNMTTGEYIMDGDEVPPIEKQANEILEFAIGTEPYGEVRWMGQALSADGMRRAEFLNNNYFRNGRHTPLLIMIQGGTLSEDSFAKLQNYMSEIKGENGQHAFMVLETEAADNTVAFEEKQQPKVEVKELASILQTDELFQGYMDNARKKIQSAFLLPDLYVGYTTDFNRATAQAAMEVTEKQVFQPERKSLAWAINHKLLGEFGFKYVEAYFLEPDISNPEDLAKVLQVCNAAGGLTPNKAKQIIYDSLGEVSEDYDGEWGDIPLFYSRSKQQNSGYNPTDSTGLDTAITKARNNSDDDIVPVLKEIKKYLQKLNNDKEH